MGQKLRLLVIEDSEDDRDLLLLNLKRGGLKPACHFIDTEEELREALQNQQWDLIISDFNMPAFDGLAALKIVRECGHDIPFILISGAIGEEIAVEAMKSGASDYFMKDNLTRLVPAVEREVNEARNRALHRKAEEQRQRLEQIIQQSLNEIYIFNSNTLRFEYANESALKNLGYTLPELAECTPLNLKTEYTYESFTALLSPLLNGDKEKIVLNTFHKRKNGSLYPAEVHLQMIKEKDQTFFAAIVLDLTSHKRSESMILKQKKLAHELALSSKYKSEFLANMSHELRTPLNSILLLSKLLTKNGKMGLNASQSEYIGEIYSSANTLMELINDVLDISKIEAGEMTFSIHTVSVETLCNNIRHAFTFLASEKGLNFEVLNTTEPGYSLKTDSLRVEQVLKNFLSNAIKFTDGGSVKITAYLPPEKELDSLFPKPVPVVAFSVQDTGIGIDKHEQNKIFEAFRQVDSSAERRFSGTGLGLSISKEIVSGLGGKISLQSSLGKGSIFTVYLPTDSSAILRGKNLLASNGDPLTESPSFSKKKKKNLLPVSHKKKNIILLVDDSDIHLSALKELIEDDFTECLTANNARETYAIVQQSIPDLIVLDLGLPDANGTDVVKKLRSTYPVDQLPIIIYSGKSLSGPEHDELGRLVNQIVQKTSGSFNKLRVAIHHIFAEQGNLILEFDQNNADHLQFLKGKKILIADDDKRNIYSLSKALEECRFHITTAANGEETLQHLASGEPIDLILMDMMMPKMNGFDAMSKIRENKLWKSIPIIAVTARAMPGDKKKCLDAGASDYISKPVDIEKMISMIFRWLGTPRQMDLFKS